MGGQWLGWLTTARHIEVAEEFVSQDVLGQPWEWNGGSKRNPPGMCCDECCFPLEARELFDELSLLVDSSSRSRSSV